MAWTTPRTWTAQEVVTAVQLNAHLRDNLIALRDGPLVLTAFGAHTINGGAAGDNSLSVRNTSAGAANRSALYLGNDTSATALFLQSFSSTYTTSGPSVAAGGLLGTEGAGGLSLVAGHASGHIRSYAGGTTEVHRLTSQGSFLAPAYNVHVGSLTYPGRVTTNPTSSINIYDGTAPVGALANGVTLYSAAGKLWAMDAAGTATKLTP